MGEVWYRPIERSYVNTRMSARDIAGDHGKVGIVQALRQLMLAFKADMLLQENGGCQDTIFC